MGWRERGREGGRKGGRGGTYVGEAGGSDDVDGARVHPDTPAVELNHGLREGGREGGRDGGLSDQGWKEGGREGGREGGVGRTSRERLAATECSSLSMTYMKPCSSLFTCLE
jgi:hypothetical protein